jgi:tetratricopeptide (TPR) repeat protein
MGLGLYGQARRSLDGAVTTRRRADAADPLALSVSLQHEGDLLTLQADFDGAEKAYRDAIAIQSSRPDDRQSQVELAKTLYGLGWMYQQKGQNADADRTLREALERQHKLYGATHGDIARTQKVLARVIADEGDLNGAIPLMRGVLAMQRELRGSEPHPDLAEAINDLGLLLEDRGDYDEAEKLFLEAIAMKRRLLGDKHPEIAMGLANLAQTLQNKGDLVQAEATFRQALAMQRELLGEVHPDVALTLNNLAFVQYDRGNTHDALATERESLMAYEKLFPADNPEVARIMNRIGFWLTEAGQYAEADKDLQASLAMRQRLVGDSHPDVATSLVHLAILQVAQRKYDEALGSSRRAIGILSSALSATHWKTAVGESAEGAALTGLGRYGEAETLLAHSLGILGKDTGAPPEYHRLAQRYLDTLHVRTGAAGAMRTPPAAPAEPPVR